VDERKFNVLLTLPSRAGCEKPKTK